MSLKEIKITDELIEVITYSYTLAAGVTRNSYQKQSLDKIFNRDLTAIEVDEIVDYVYFKYIYEEIQISSHFIDKAKHAKGRTPKEREKRRIDDFKKNTLPTLSRDEQSYFNKKFKAKGL